jgi:hypothetical protein
MRSGDMCERFRSAKARFVMSEGSMKENAQFVQSLLDDGAKIIEHRMVYSGDGASDTYAVSVLYVPNYFTVYEAASSVEVAEAREKVREDIEAAETTDGAPTAEPDVTSDDDIEAPDSSPVFPPESKPEATTVESEDVAKDTIDGLQKQADADEAEKADEADERR